MGTLTLSLSRAAGEGTQVASDRRSAPSPAARERVGVRAP